MIAAQKWITRGGRLGVAAALLLAGWAWVGASWARPENVTPEERALLPEYCDAVQEASGYATGFARWTAVYGEAFNSFHHYCWAFIYLMRADRHSTANQRQMLMNAYDEIAYVLRATPPDHVLVPEMLTKQGMILRRQGRIREAIDRLEKAAALNPKYWRAYAELAQCYLAQNDKRKALEVVEEGLTHSPDSRALAAWLKDLGGQQRAGPTRPSVTSAERTGTDAAPSGRTEQGTRR